MDAPRADVGASGTNEVGSRGARGAGGARGAEARSPLSSRGLSTRERAGLEPSPIAIPGRGARRRHAGAERAERGAFRAGRGRAREARGPARIAAKAMPAGMSAIANIARRTMTPEGKKLTWRLIFIQIAEV